MTQAHISFTLFTIILNVIGGNEVPLPPPVVSRSCMELGICESVENYPTVLATKLIKELKDDDVLIADDDVFDISQESRHRQKNTNTWTYRTGGFISHNEEDNKEIPLCETTVQYKAPKIAENRNNTWKFILNDAQEPVQTFRVERCKSKPSKCSEEVNFIPNYVGVCVQKWILKEMYYIDEVGNRALDYFKVPTCCTCRLFHTNK